jgi:hypothetical protein
MKGGNSGNNGSNLYKGNILKPTFDTLTEEGRKAFDAYRANLEELFLLHYGVTRHVTVFKDTTPIIFNRPEVIPEVRPNESLSHNDVQFVINSALEKQIKSVNELLCRLIVEQDGKKLDTTSANPSSSTCTVSFTQTNSHTSGPSVGGTSMPNPFAEPVNHFHSQTTIEGLTPTLGMTQQTMANMFEQWYIHTAPSITIPNPSSAPYTSWYNGRAYPNPNDNYQATYTTVTYTDPIPLPRSPLGFLLNHAYQNTQCFNTYDQLEVGGVGFETCRNFPLGHN